MLLLREASKARWLKGLCNYPFHNLLVYNHSWLNIYCLLIFLLYWTYSTCFATLIFQGVFLHSWGVLVGWISGKCLSHQVQDSLCGKPPFLWDSEEGSFCCWCCFCLLHCHSFWVLLYQLLKCQGKLPTICWGWDWCWHGNLQMSLLVKKLHSQFKGLN